MSTPFPVHLKLHIHVRFRSFCRATLIMTMGTEEERLTCTLTSFFCCPSYLLIIFLLDSYRIFDIQGRGRVYRGGFSAVLSELYPQAWADLESKIDQMMAKMDPDRQGTLLALLLFPPLASQPHIPSQVL